MGNRTATTVLFPSAELLALCRASRRKPDGLIYEPGNPEPVALLECKTDSDRDELDAARQATRQMLYYADHLN